MVNFVHALVLSTQIKISPFLMFQSMSTISPCFLNTPKQTRMAKVQSCTFQSNAAFLSPFFHADLLTTPFCMPGPRSRCSSPRKGDQGPEPGCFSPAPLPILQASSGPLYTSFPAHRGRNHCSCFSPVSTLKAMGRWASAAYDSSSICYPSLGYLWPDVHAIFVAQEAMCSAHPDAID